LRFEKSNYYKNVFLHPSTKDVLKLKPTIFFLLFATNGTFLYAQQQKVIYPHTVFWSKTEVTEIFPSGWGLGGDFVYRRKNEMNKGSMFMSPLRESFRPWIHYQFSPYARFSLSPLGYMNTNEYIGKEADYLRLPYHELRTTFQFFHHIKQLDGKIMHTWRYRYEMRWQERPGQEEYRYLNRFRFRYRIRYLINTNDFYQNNVLYLAVSNEIGLNFGKNVVYNVFNQNRFYAGIGYRFLNAARVEVRYVDRIRTRGATGFEFDHGRGLMLGIYIDQLSKLARNKKIENSATDD
jgi:hypothetical protein